MSNASELGTGDVPDVAKREEPGRYSRTSNGLLASLVVTVLVVVAFVAFRGLFRDQPAIEREAVDYLGTVEAAQGAGMELVYPETLPDGWIATSIDFIPGKPPAWGIGMLTDDGRFVGLRQEDADVADLVEEFVDDNAESGGAATLDSALSTGRWQTWADSGGDLAYSTTLNERAGSATGDTLLVFGSADQEDQEELIALLTIADLG